MRALEHTARVEAAPTQRRMGYRAACSCGWASKRMRTAGKAEFEARMHEEVEDVKAAAREEL